MIRQDLLLQLGAELTRRTLSVEVLDQENEEEYEAEDEEDLADHRLLSPIGAQFFLLLLLFLPAFGLARIFVRTLEKAFILRLI